MNKLKYPRPRLDLVKRKMMTHYYATMLGWAPFSKAYFTHLLF